MSFRFPSDCLSSRFVATAAAEARKRTADEKREDKEAAAPMREEDEKPVTAVAAERKSETSGKRVAKAAAAQKREVADQGAVAVGAAETLKREIEKTQADAEEQMQILSEIQMNAMESMNGTINQTMELKMSAMNSKLSTLNERVTKVENSIESLQKLAKFQRLAYSLDNIDSKDLFEYYEYGKTGMCENGKILKRLVKNILSSFRQGLSHQLPHAVLTPYGPVRNKVGFEKCRADFRNKLINQIHELTGTMPRIELGELDSNQEDVIYYS